MKNSSARWILAFDGSCGSCGGVADAVSAACGDRIEVFPLQNDTVSAWRLSALGVDAEWKPVLMKISDDDGKVQAWTGARLASHLMARLGAGASVGILRALGQLRTMNSRGEVRRPGDLEPLMGLSRKRFLRNVGLGAATVAGILVSGAAPASADTVKSWASKNAGSLPTTLPELSVLQVAFRRVAYREMTAEQQSAAWTAHLNGFSAEVAGLGSTQRAVFAKVQTYAKNPANFRAPDQAALEALAAAANNAFGKDQAASMIATLGPSETQTASRVTPNTPSCTCAAASDWCNNNTRCVGLVTACNHHGGCGSFWSYTCDGLCYN